ncbi:MAG TPA: bifunctional polysaccharide deacetylase/glycosyltransferase family 2 protein [Nakamurella sp.]|nr:bifunctional polysaccharide deacetylase/glycosyltransferase family 2 protein [Nakamurella sp.]
MTRHRPAPALRSHWVLLALTMVLLGMLMAAYAVTAGERGDGNGPPPAAGVPAPAALRTGGPVIDAGGPLAPGARPAARTIALTFDDGPGPDTAAILDVLDRYGVPATFFVLGADAAQHPGLLRRMVADGSEIGLHGFTHRDLGTMPAWRQRLELAQTQYVVAAATGHTTNLLRLPYSGTPATMDAADVTAMARAGNYRVVFADLDTRDWARPGADAIAGAAVPPAGAGAIVLLHDGGGDRGQTLQALDRLIPRLQAAGYTFTTVSAAIGADDAMQPAGLGERARGWVTIAAVQISHLLVPALSVLTIAVTVLSLLRIALVVPFARRHHRRPPVAHPDHAPPVTVIIPAYNEEVGIAAAVRSVALSDYPDLEIIVVDDGSTDDTVLAVEELELPRVRVLRQPNQGKAVALNTGVAAARGEVLVLVDGDTVFTPDTVRLLVRGLADPEVGAVAGNTKVGNRRGLLGKWQHVEYVLGFNLDRRMFDVLQCMPTVPGAIGAFRREALQRVGGVPSDTLAEDTDLTMAICRAGYLVRYEPEALAWTEAPATLGELWRQRYRWCFGTLQAMWKHRGAVLQRGQAGKLGRRGLPYLLLFQVLLPLLAPLMDLLLVYQLIVRTSPEVVVAWVTFVVLQLLCTVFAFRLDHEPLRPMWVVLTQQIVYRQLMYLVVVQSMVSALAGMRLRWYKLRRTGDLQAAAGSVPL